MDDFDYNVPTIFDFKQDIRNVDSYFDQINENIKTNLKITEEPEEKFYTPVPFQLPPKKEFNTTGKNLRRSLSATDLEIPTSAPNAAKSNIKRAVSKDGGLNAKKTSERCTVQQKFVSMAEAINRFHKVTPLRFHSKLKASPKPVPCKLTVTIPQSPALNTKMRHRTTHVLSSNEKELQEFQEQQKFKIKAHPVDYRALKGPMKVDVKHAAKATTKPEPFKLTAPTKTQKEPEIEPVRQFQASNVPKSLYVPSKPPKPHTIATVPVTPSFMKNAPKRTQMKKSNSDITLNKKGTMEMNATKVEPFTFEHKYDMAKKKKEEFIKKVLDEERKAREFHARPMPKLFQRTRTTSASSSHKSESDLREVQFKARPATVLQKEPFVPKKSARPLVEMTDILLNTERRAEDREGFHRLLREKEEHIESIRRQREQMRQIEEMKEIQRLRKGAEHVAQPIRKYKEVKKMPPIPVTAPISPKFLSGSRRNKENLGDVN